MEFTLYEYVLVPEFGVYLALYVPLNILFIIRRNIEPIASRGWILAVLQSFIGCFCFFSTTISNKTITCYPTFLTQALLMPLWAFPYFIRSWNLWFNYYYGLGLLKINPKDDTMKSMSSSTKGKYRMLKWILEKRWLVSTQFQVGLFCIIAVVFFILGIVAVQLGYTPENCGNSFMSDIVYTQFGVVVLFIALAIQQLWNIEDPYYIKLELKTSLVVGIITFIIWIVSTFANFPLPIIPGFWTAQCIVAYFFITICMPLFYSFRLSTLFKKERKDKIEMKKSDTSKENFDDDLLVLALRHPIMLKSFEK